MLPTVSADEWLNLNGPAPAALSVPSKHSAASEFWRPRASRPVVKAQPQMEKLKWKVLLYAGEAQNHQGEVGRVGTASQQTHPLSGQSAAQPFWSTSLQITSTGGGGQHRPSPRTNVQKPSPNQHGVNDGTPRRPSTSDGAKRRPQPPPTTTGSLARSPSRHVSGATPTASPRGLRVTTSTRNNIVPPTTAVFSKDHGIFLHDTLPAVLHSSVSGAAAPPAASTSCGDGPNGSPEKTAVDVQELADQPPPPHRGSTPQHLRPCSAPSARDIQSIKRLIRLVQVETGETQFRQSLDSRVLQSLIPTATMHRASPPHTSSEGQQQQRKGEIGNGMGGGVAVRTSASSSSSPRCTRSATKVQPAANVQPPLQKPKLTTGELTTSLVGPTSSGDLALGVCGGGGGGGAPGNDALHTHDIPHHPAVVQSPRSDKARPRPTSARVLRPAFTYQRTFDGHMTLEHWQQDAATMQQPRFLQFSADTIPVVGRR